MTALTAFDFENNPVRAFEREDGSVWFVALDACRALGLSNSRKTTSALDPDERDDVTLSDAIGRDQRTTIISEGGLYTLILRSRAATTPGTLPHRFRKWVTAEVLPAIRRSGRYAPALPLEARPFGEWPLDELRARTQVVGMYRAIYGAKSARWIAREVGFPVPPIEARRYEWEQDEYGDWVKIYEDDAS